MAWLHLNSTLSRKVRGSCEDGTNISVLGKNSFENCRPCPYKCTSTQNKYLCTPRTEIPSESNDCAPEEVCCELQIQSTTTVPFAVTSPIPQCPEGYQCVNESIEATSYPCYRREYYACPSKRQMCCLTSPGNE